MFAKSSDSLKAIAICALLSGCSTLSVPDKPATALATPPPSEFSQSVALPLQSQSPWWTQFQDPDLNALITRALAQNVSLELAQANIRTAQAQLARAQLGTRYTTASSADVSLGRTSRPNQDIELSAAGALSASWEYDAFGRIAASIKAAEFNEAIAQQTARDVAVLTSANTALAYINLRGAQARLDVARDNAETQLKTLNILQDLVDNGQSTELDLRRSDAQYRTTLASLPIFTAAQDRAIAALAALTGQYANAADTPLTSLKTTPRPVPTFSGALVTGQVEDLLRRRPDIQIAEARIGQLLALSDVERARLFPTLSFNANILSLFNGTNRLDQLSSFGFGFGPALTWEGPDLTRVRADIQIADRQTEAAVLAYEQAVITAISEVEQALSTYTQNLERLEDLEQAATSARQAREFADLRFEEGLDGFLDVLDAQRTLLAREDQLADARQIIGLSAVALYQALGGV